MNSVFVIVLAAVAVALLQGPAYGHAGLGGSYQGNTVVGDLHGRPAASPPPRGIVLLPGYTHKRAADFEGNRSGVISSEHGVTIEYEGGSNQGLSAHPTRASEYRWFKNYVVDERRIYVALDKSDHLLISFPWAVLDTSEPRAATNFRAHVRNSEQVAEVLLMVLGCKTCDSPEKAPN